MPKKRQKARPQLPAPFDYHHFYPPPGVLQHGAGQTHSNAIWWAFALTLFVLVAQAGIVIAFVILPAMNAKAEEEKKSSAPKPGTTGPPTTQKPPSAESTPTSGYFDWFRLDDVAFYCIFLLCLSPNSIAILEFFERVTGFKVTGGTYFVEQKQQQRSLLLAAIPFVIVDGLVNARWTGLILVLGPFMLTRLASIVAEVLEKRKKRADAEEAMAKAESGWDKKGWTDFVNKHNKAIKDTLKRNPSILRAALKNKGVADLDEVEDIVQTALELRKPIRQRIKAGAGAVWGAIASPFRAAKDAKKSFKSARETFAGIRESFANAKPW